MSQPKKAEEELLRHTSERAIDFVTEHDLDPLLERLAKAQVVFLGESTHGTEDFYGWRRHISQRLMAEHGFSYIATDFDWSDAINLHRYLVTGREVSSLSVLQGVSTWPAWRLANNEIIRLIEWMRQLNIDRTPENKVGFFGLDVYSLYAMVQTMLELAEQQDPFLAKRIENQYIAFETFPALLEMKAPLQLNDRFKANLIELLIRTLEQKTQRNQVPDSGYQNELLNRASAYFNVAVLGNRQAWDRREAHLLDVLDRLLTGQFQTMRRKASQKAIVWAHNSHVADYLATNSTSPATLGHLARNKWGEQRVALMGFGTCSGTVLASRSWNSTPRVAELAQPAPGADTIDNTFCRACEVRGLGQFGLVFTENDRKGLFSLPVSQRATGSVYEPGQQLSYTTLSLAHAYDVYLFVDKSTALSQIRAEYLSAGEAYRLQH